MYLLHLADILAFLATLGFFAVLIRCVRKRTVKTLKMVFTDSIV